MTFPLARATLLVALVFAVGCADESADSYASPTAMEEMEMVDAAAPAADDAVPTATVAQTLQGDAPEPAAERLLRRTAQLRIRAQNHARAVEQARALIADTDAFIGGESSSRYDDQVETTLTIRVPSAAFDGLMTELSELPGQIETRSISVDDVTRDVADVSARLETKRLAEAQYRELLGRAGSIEDVLAVQTRLQTVREEIESTEAQLRVLRDQVSLSTITLAVYEASAAGITSGPGFFAQAGRSIARGWDGAVEFLLAMLTLWPFLLGVAALVWTARRWRRRRRAAI